MAEYDCLRCNTTGVVERARDLHRSGGEEKCDFCRGTGCLNEEKHAFFKRLGYRVAETPRGI